MRDGSPPWRVHTIRWDVVKWGEGKHGEAGSCDAVFHTAHAASGFWRRPNKAPLIIWGRNSGLIKHACITKSLPSQRLNSPKLNFQRSDLSLHGKQPLIHWSSTLYRALCRGWGATGEPGDLSDAFPTLDTLNQDKELGSKTFKKST